MADWTIDDIPRQTGRLAVITGSTGGLGFETALGVAGAGADVVLTGRNAQKGQTALNKIHAQHPGASIRYAHLDLASLASVRQFAEQFAGEHGALDLLINNAGVMMPPKRQTTSDGFELQFGTNYPGHFALTERLLPLPRAGRQPRVVNVSRAAHKIGAAIHFDGLQWQLSDKPWAGAIPGGYYGPRALFEMKGPPGEAQTARHAQDKAVAARLWEVSEALTNARWPGATMEHAS